MKAKIFAAVIAAAAMAICLSSCSDMMWGVGTEVSSDYGSPYYYGYTSGIWNNAVNGFYGPYWTTPPPRPPRRPWAPEPGIVIPNRPVGANRPNYAPSRPVQNPEGVTGSPILGGGQGSNTQRPGNMGRP